MFYKNVKDGYIVSIGTTDAEGNITESEYNQILSVIKNKPEPTEDIDYLLKEDLTWESYQVERVEPEADAEELLDILIGESND